MQCPLSDTLKPYPFICFGFSFCFQGLIVGDFLFLFFCLFVVVVDSNSFYLGIYIVLLLKLSKCSFENC